MVRAEVTIGYRDGICLKPANRIVNVADSFLSRIHLRTDDMDINAKKLINVVSGLFQYGDTVLCVCDGPDEREALAAMKEVLSGYGEE